MYLSDWNLGYHSWDLEFKLLPHKNNNNSNNKTMSKNRYVWGWHMPVMPTLGRLQQVSHQSCDHETLSQNEQTQDTTKKGKGSMIAPKKSLLGPDEERCNHLARPRASLSVEHCVKTALQRSRTPCHLRCGCHYFTQKIKWQLASPVLWSKIWLHDTNATYSVNTNELVLSTKRSQRCWIVIQQWEPICLPSLENRRYTRSGLERWLNKVPASQAWGPEFAPLTVTYRR